MNTKKKVQPLNFDLTQILFDIDHCKPDQGKETCRFLSDCFGSPICTRFTKEGVQRNKEAEVEVQYQQGTGCHAGLIEILQTVKRDLLYNEKNIIGKKIEYTVGHHLFPEQMIVENIIFREEKKKFKILIRTERDTFPFTINSDFLCIYRNTERIRFASLLGDHSGSVDIIL